MLKKSGRALTFLAGEMLAMQIGSRLPTFTQYAEQTRFSRGTLQAAISALESIGAVVLINRGHMGRFLVSKDMTILMECIGMTSVTGIMPLPYTKVYEGLATGINTTIEKNSSLSVNLAYMRGSENRILSLINRRCDFVITSKNAAAFAIQKGYDIAILKDFGKGSFLRGHSIVFSKAEFTSIVPGMKIGVDPESFDHVYLSNIAVGGYEVEYVNINYNQIMSMINDGKIDAAVWNTDNILEGFAAINHVPLIAKDISGNDVAVMLIARENRLISMILNEYADVGAILDKQQKVINSEIYPTY